jgi:hypothetical protein
MAAWNKKQLAALKGPHPDGLKAVLPMKATYITCMFLFNFV